MTGTDTTAPVGGAVIGVGDSQARAVAQALLGAPVGDDGLVAVSQADLASASGLPGRTLRRVLGRLRDAGWVGVARPATTRAPAAYDTARLRQVAAEAGLTPTAPAPATGGGVVPVGVRRLTAAEAADPGGAVVVGGRYLVDPRLLQAGENVRRDLRAAGLVDDVRVNGILKDIDVYPALTGLVVLDGHRRLHAALALGLEEVAVRVVSCDGEAERICYQLGSNDQHAHNSAVERADAITQLVLMGVPAAEVRRRASASAEEVEAARAVARAPQVVRDVAVARPGVDLLTLASLASLAAGAVPGSRVVARAAEAVVERPEQASHVVARAATEVLEERLLAEAAAALEAEGTPLHEGDVWGEPGVEYLEDLVDGAGRDLEAASHASCPGHAAVLRLVSHWRTGEDGSPQVRVLEGYRPRYVCTAWRDHHRKRAATAASGASCGPRDESARAARRDLVARNQAWDAANGVRRAWVRDVLLARRPPADAAVWQVPLLTGAPAWTTRASVARGWEHVGRTEAGSCHPATPAQAARDLVAWTAVLAEGVIGRTTWRDAAPALLGLVRLHLRSLEVWGYTLSDVEADLCRAVEAGGGDALHALPGGGAR